MGTARWVVIVLASIATAAHAADATGVEGETRWRCWYAPDVENPVIACRLLEAGEGVIDNVATATPLPPFVQRIRTDPRSLADNIVVIPLHAPPIDMRFASRLASGVMCGRRAACSVDFGNEPGG